MWFASGRPGALCAAVSCAPIMPSISSCGATPISPAIGRVLPPAHFVIGLLDPERLNRLVAENVVPVVGLRSVDAFQGLFPIICNDCSGLVVVADRIFRSHHQVLMVVIR